MQHAIPILIGVFIFGLLIFVHEWGHFIAARRCGILVEEFAFGMGPKLFGYKPGETLYSIRLFPLGGFCSMHGMDEDSDHERSFMSKKVSRRMIVILAGSAMNLALALAIFATGSLTSSNGFATPVVGTLMPGGPAELAGLLPGDHITRIDGNTVNIYEDVLVSITTSTSDTIRIEFARNGSRHQVYVSPVLNNDRRIIGITPQVKLGAFQSEREGFVRASFYESIRRGTFEMLFLIRHTFGALGDLVTGRASMDMITGPIGIVGIIDDNFQATVSRADERSALDTFLQLFRSNFMFAGVLSAAIGIFNLLPLPALDGGRFVFLALEGVRNRPMKPETEGTIHFVGFVVLMVFAVFIAYRDVMRLLLPD